MTSVLYKKMAFVLTHRSGLTLKCLALVVSFINEGKKISSVEHAVFETRKETYYQKSLRDLELHKALGREVKEENRHVPKFEETIAGTLYPGRKLLLSAYLQHVWQYELYYRQRMHNISINEDWICCDHTFKSVTNIGIYQTQGANAAKWIKQFKSLFIVFNEVGQVLSWQLGS